MTFVPSSPFEARLLEVVEGIEYGDGWSFEVRRDPGGVGVQVRWDVVDVRDPRASTSLLYRIEASRFDFVYGAAWLQVFLHELWHAIGHLEGHERLERLRWRGQTVWDPHPVPGDTGLLSGPHGQPDPALVTVGAA